MIALVAVVVGGGALALRWISLRWPAPASSEGHAPASLAQPPDDLPPAIAGALGDDSVQVRWQHALGALLDLAQRGVVEIEESSRDDGPGAGGRVVRLASTPSSLRPHERSLLTLVFGPEALAGAEARLSAARFKRSYWKKRFAACVAQEMEAAGLLSRERQMLKRRLLAGAHGLLALGLGGAVVGVAQVGRWGGWPLLVPVSLIAVGGILRIVAAAFPVLSDEGRRRARRWRRFASHLRDLALGVSRPASPDVNESYLPYAASYGLAEAWAARFGRGSHA